MESYSIFPLGDQAVTFSLGNVIHGAHHAKMVGMERWFRQHPFSGLVDIVVAYSSLTLVFDLYAVKNQTQAKSAFEFIQERILEAFHRAETATAQPTAVIEIPVCYDPAFSPDLDFLCEQKKLTREEVIELHTSTSYRVFMIGFLPGFPYMGEVHERIRMPRKEKPRSQVEAGSVGIAGVQTGIYPVASPGGWQIIGRTPLRLFDKDRNPPVLLEAGNRVKFYPISKQEFGNYKENLR